MNEEQVVREPSGRDETESAQAGRPQEQSESDSQSDARPNLDARERRISEHRKAAGPPLEEPDEPVDEEGREGLPAQRDRDVEPVDPVVGETGGGR